jgi:hypothetical protein
MFNKKAESKKILSLLDQFQFEDQNPDSENNSANRTGAVKK